MGAGLLISKYIGEPDIKVYVPREGTLLDNTESVKMKNFKFCVFIGQFSPFHNGQSVILQEALNQAETVLVVLGSDKKARNIEVPWNTEQRIEMIKSTVSEEDQKRIVFIPIRDHIYSDTIWVAELLEKVSVELNGSKSVALVCREKYNQDYLKLFPQWELITVKTTEPHHNAEDIRHRYFTYDTSYARFVHENVAKFMKSFQDLPAFLTLKSDFDYVKKYKALWEGAPFKPIFVTVDSVIVKSGHILLVKRKGNPGKGQMALPGGFLDQDELIEDAAIREVKEETAIKMTQDELRSCIKYYDVFDAPKRSLRGRTITHAYLIDLGSGALPKVKGSDDAEKAFWLPLNEVKDREDEFFEDHFHIISSLTNKL